MRRTVMLLLAVLALSGCTGGSGAPPSASGSSPAAAPASATQPPVQPSTTVDSVAPPAPSHAAPPPGNPTEVLVLFGRHGGIAGFADRLTVQQSGAFTLTRARPRIVDRVGQLTPAELANLRQVLAQAGFAGLPKVEKGDAVDAFTYSVTYRGEMIVAQDGAIAPALRPVIATLSSLVARYGG